MESATNGWSQKEKIRMGMILISIKLVLGSTSFGLEMLIAYKFTVILGQQLRNMKIFRYHNVGIKTDFKMSVDLKFCV